MSRNLSSRCCDICNSEVVLVEPEREITRDDAGSYYDESRGFGHRNAIVANAECTDCGAKYLALIDMSKCPGYGAGIGADYFKRREDAPFFDLSYRNSFNDEPADADLPTLNLGCLRYVTVRPIVKWFDLWVGAYVDRENFTVYLLPIPCVGIAVSVPSFLRKFRRPWARKRGY